MRKKPRQSRAKTTVEAIQEGALQVLQSVGYEKLTTTKVAERAGVSVGTLYQYYANKDSLMQSLAIEYLGRIERALSGLLTEESNLHTLARRLVRRFIAFKIEGGHNESLRGVFLASRGQALANEATASVVAALALRIRAGKPRWSAARANEVANMWAALVFGATTATLDRDPALVAEAWFGESLERAMLAVLDGPGGR